MVCPVALLFIWNCAYKELGALWEVQGLQLHNTVLLRVVGHVDSLVDCQSIDFSVLMASAVSDEQMVHAAERFPINPPQNKEEYYYRSIFAEHFPSDSAAKSVPSVPSVACSTAEALAWDASFKNQNDPSGRAVAGVHEQAYK